MKHRIPHTGHAIAQLQGITQTVVAGAAAATNIPVAGLNTKDEIVSVIMFTAGAPSDVTADASIPTDGNLQLASDSTGNQLMVTYLPYVNP